MFNLVSSYHPTGDQPQAISQLSSWIKSGNKYQTLLGVTGSGKTYTLANVIAQVRLPTLVISHNKTLAAQLYQELRDYFPQNAVSYFVSYYDYYQPESYLPATDTYIEKETNINDEIDQLRLATTANLLSRPDVIVVASVSCIYNLGSPDQYAHNRLDLVPRELINLNVLITRLSEMQYLRSDYDLKRGTFRVRGDTLTVWPGNTDFAYKLLFTNLYLQTIEKINPLTGEPIPVPTKSNQLKITLYPAKQYQTQTPDLKSIYQQIESDLKTQLAQFKQAGKVLEAYRLAQRVKYDLQMIREFGYVNGIENYSRYFDGRNPGQPPSSLLDYFNFNANKFKQSTTKPSPFLTVIDESHITLPQLRGMFRGDASRKRTLIDYGFRLSAAIDNRPLKFTEIIPRLPQIIFSSATPDSWELNHSGCHVAEQLVRPTGIVDPLVSIKPEKNQILDLYHEIILRQAKGERVLVTTLTKKTAEDLTDFFNNPAKINSINRRLPQTTKPQRPLKVQYLHADVEVLKRSDILADLRRGQYDVLIGINLLREGLDLPEVSLVAILEAGQEGFLRSKTSLIQIMGRAARHQNGSVILYSDKLTPAINNALAEVNRRRQYQLKYNRLHQLTPQSINKPLRSDLVPQTKSKNLDPHYQTNYLTSFGFNSFSDIDPNSLTPKDRRLLIKRLRKGMSQAAATWDFEQAAKLRDLINNLKQHQ